MKEPSMAGTFKENIQKYLRKNGYTQQELAAVLSLHPKVLSRKLNKSGKARLTQQEIQKIIMTLAEWRVITTRLEALKLLEEAEVQVDAFDEEDWATAPLRDLTVQGTPIQPPRLLAQPELVVSRSLPASTTRLIGREWAVGRLLQLLRRPDVRLMTLLGPGGSGKTRLALQVARQAVEMFAQGIAYVPLAGVSDPAQVPMSIIQALDIKPAANHTPLESLIGYLRNKELLLVLDNFEHVGDVTTLVDELLAEAAGLKVLVTSRFVLRLYGEYEFSVPPLDLPDAQIALGPTELLHYAAVQLFVERVQAIMPDFVLSTENAGTIARICTRLDGLPLALELAAARIKVLSPSLLLERISKEPLAVLTGGAKNLPSRQQTLRNTISWSYDLLTTHEQAGFRYLGVFAGGWRLEAAEALLREFGLASLPEEHAEASGAALDMLELLVNHSLVVNQVAGAQQQRFTMLETLREYALERLAAHEELERLRDWHASYYLREVEAAELGLRGLQQLTWLARLAAERDNFSATLEWLLQRARVGAVLQGTELEATEACLRLTAAFRPYWEWQGYLSEGRDWLGAALALPIVAEAGASVLAARAKCLSEAARLVCLQNDQVRAVALAEESIALWRRLELADASGLVTALLHRGWAAHAQGEYATAMQQYEEGLQLLAPTDTWLRAQVLFYMAAAAGFAGDFELTRSCYNQSRELFEQVGDACSVADLLKDQGGMLILESRYTEAIDCLLKSISLCYEMNHKQFISTGMGLLSYAFGMRDEADMQLASIHSAQIGGASEALMETVGLTPWTKTHPFAMMVRQHIRSRIDEQTWAEAWAEGRALSAEQAIALANQLRQELYSSS